MERVDKRPPFSCVGLFSHQLTAPIPRGSHNCRPGKGGACSYTLVLRYLLGRRW